MSDKTGHFSEALLEYMSQVSLRSHPILEEIARDNKGHFDGQMQISPEQGQLMSFLVRLIGAKHALELGVFTGYSSLAVALALPEDGQLIACDLHEEWTNKAKKYWEMAGVSNKIDLRLAPAATTLQSLIDECMSFDFSFIDADKVNVATYYEMCLQLTRPGGLILIDNIFLGGDVIDKYCQNSNVKAMRAFNNSLKADQRVDISLIPIGDGLMLARKL